MKANNASDMNTTFNTRTARPLDGGLTRFDIVPSGGAAAGVWSNGLSIPTGDIVDKHSPKNRGKETGAKINLVKTRGESMGVGGQ